MIGRWIVAHHTAAAVSAGTRHDKPDPAGRANEPSKREKASTGRQVGQRLAVARTPNTEAA